MYVYVCLCMSMYVYVCLCMSMYVYVCLCMSVYVCQSMFVSLSVYICLCLSVYVCLSISVCLCLCFYVCLYLSVYLCMSVYVCLCMFFYVCLSEEAVYNRYLRWSPTSLPPYVENRPPTQSPKHKSMKGNLSTWMKSFLSNRLIQTKSISALSFKAA